MPSVVFPTRITEAQLAERTGQSVRTIQSWRGRGVGPRFLKFGRSVRYDLDEVERWEAEQVRNSTSQAQAA